MTKTPPSQAVCWQNRHQEQMEHQNLVMLMTGGKNNFSKNYMHSQGIKLHLGTNSHEYWILFRAVMDI